MTDDELAQGFINIINAELVRGGWLSRHNVDEIRAEAVTDCWALTKRVNPVAPFAYIRQAARHIILSASKRVAGLPTEDVQQFDRPVSDTRAEARAELDSIRQRIREHIDEGERLYRDVTRIMDSI